jgi:hypothetical protein
MVIRVEMDGAGVESAHLDRRSDAAGTKLALSGAPRDRVSSPLTPSAGVRIRSVGVAEPSGKPPAAVKTPPAACDGAGISI